MERIMRKVAWFIEENKPLVAVAAVALVSVPIVLVATRGVSTSLARPPRAVSLSTLGGLEKKVEAAIATSSASGVLQPITGSTHLVAAAGIPFVVFKTIEKTFTLKSSNSRVKSSEKVDQLAVIPPDLVVDDDSLAAVGYRIVLNKYPVMPSHGLLVTSEFESQNEDLDLNGFTALWSVVAASKSFGFYNCRDASGSSQPRRHLQFIPLAALLKMYPIGVTTPLPVDKVISATRASRQYKDAPGEPFEVEAFTNAGIRHSICVLGRNLFQYSPARAAEVLVGWYNTLKAASGADTAPGHNILITPQWMMVVPRTQSGADDIESNALGYAGFFLARGDAQFTHLQGGAMEILAACTAE